MGRENDRVRDKGKEAERVWEKKGGRERAKK